MNVKPKFKYSLDTKIYLCTVKAVFMCLVLALSAVLVVEGRN